MSDPIHYRYDTFSPRIASTIIDGLIVVAPLIVLQYLIDIAGVFSLSFCFSILTSVAGWTYYILGHGLYGRTVGKRQQNLRVVDFKSEQPITMLQAFVRELPFILLGVIALSVSAVVVLVPMIVETVSVLNAAVLFLQLVFLFAQVAFCVTSPKCRAIHDLIGGTVVVRDNVPLELATNELQEPSEA